MNHKFGGLDVTGVLLSQEQTSLWREEHAQHMVLVSVRDPKSNESGHVLYCLELNKRDCVDERTWTDNARLFATEHPEAYQLQELLGLPDADTPRVRTEEIDTIIHCCMEGSDVIYLKGEAGWGLYAS